MSKGWMPEQWRGCTNRRDVSAFRKSLGLEMPHIDDEKRLFVNCGKCDNCQRDRAKDWIGRTQGEAFGADRSYFVTLTIGGRDYFRDRGVSDNWRAIEFHKDDVRAYIKRCRFFQWKDWRNGLKEAGLDWQKHVAPRLRFFYVGENGDLKGRVHYHLLAYYYGSEGPKLEMDKDVFHGKMDASVELGAYENVDTDRTWWPWGWSNWQQAEPHHSWYLSRYVNKGALIARDGASVMRPGISTRPLLGARYFDVLAGDYVRNGLAPQTRTYRTPDNPHYRGKPVTYWMSDAAMHRFAGSYIRQWNAAYEADPGNRSKAMPESEALTDYLDARSVIELGRSRDDIEDGLFRLRLSNATQLRDVRFDWVGYIAGDQAANGFLTWEEFEDRLRWDRRQSEMTHWGFERYS